MSYFWLAVVVLFNIAGNVLLKLGAIHPFGPRLGFVSLPTIAGIGLFGLGVLLYTRLLTFVPLHVAQAMLSLQYIGVILAAGFIFGEVINLKAWIGFAFIIGGLFLVVHQ